MDKKLPVIVNIDRNTNWVEMQVQGSGAKEMTLRLSSPLPDVWRLQSTTKGVPYEDLGAIQRLASIDQSKPEGMSSLLELQVSQKPNVSIVTAAGSNVRAEIGASPLHLVFKHASGVRGVEITGVAQEKDSITVQCPLSAKERVYGTGERFNGVNQRGKRVVLWAEDRWCQKEGNSYLPIPFIISTEKYAVLANRFETSIFDLGSTQEDAWTLMQSDAPLDIYVFLEDDPRDIYRKLTLLWGRPALPPKWGFGVLVSRHEQLHEFGSVDGIREMASKMKEHDLPWSGVIIEGWDIYNTDTYSELAKIVHEMHNAGKKVMAYNACGRLSEKFWIGQKAQPEYFVRTAEGNCSISESPYYNPYDAPDRRKSCFIDITSPQTLDWWHHQVWKQLLVDIGIDGAKIDFCEQFPEDINIRVFSKESLKGMHHFYPVKYNVFMHDLFQKYCREGGVSWSRGGSIGAHKYPFVWCGDQLREFHFLPAVLSALLSSGMSGIPFMGHDLGGYIPAQNGDNEAEVFIRGAQLACFSAAMSTHGTVTRPYEFEPNIIGLYRLYSHIRYLLLPYLQEQAAKSCSTGMPLVRHMFLQYPEEESLWDCEDEYFLGEDLLVAPVLSQTCKRDVQLPPGRWMNIFDKSEHKGPAVIRDYAVPLRTIPVFAAVPMQNELLPGVIDKIRDLMKTGRPEKE